MNKAAILPALLLSTALNVNAFSPARLPTTVAGLSSSSMSSAMSSSAMSMSTQPGEFDYALIFDCDGVIIETEELHRLAYNAAFKAAGLEIEGEAVEWSVEYYDILQNTVGGGKGKMFYHFRTTKEGKFPTSTIQSSIPQTDDEQQALIDSLQEHKTELYKDLIAEKATPRPGVIELMDEAMNDPKIAVGVCSASTKAAVTKVLDVTLGKNVDRNLMFVSLVMMCRN
jgi:phosphoglycolate phosphatase-like HAD superfamily hydrolase